MNRRQAPQIDGRTSAALYRELAERLGFAECPEGSFGPALLRVFARYCEIVMERLNRVPEKNHLAFLNQLAIAPAPPVAAQVPITFEPVKQLPPGDAHWVPAHTKVAASPGSGRSDPVVYETECDLALTPLRLQKVIVHDPAADLFADRSAWAVSEAGMDAAAFAGDTPVEHALYLGDSTVFSTDGISELRVRFDLANRPPAFPRDALEWRVLTPKGPVTLVPAEDGTQQLTRSGEVVFRDLPPWPRTPFRGLEHSWLICRLRCAGNPARQASALPVLKGIALKATGRLDEAPVAKALFNSLPLDTSKPYYPLGEWPRFGDVFYLSCETFSRPGATIELKIKLFNPAGAERGDSVRAVDGRGEPRIVWETLAGERWMGLAVRDQTCAFTRDGTVRFAAPAPAAKGNVNGQEGFWVRARLVAGRYGEAADPAPPVIESISVSAGLELQAPALAQVVTCNGLAVETVDFSRQAAFSPFSFSQDASPCLYLGFQSPAGGRPDVLDVYFHLGVGQARAHSCSEHDGPQAVLAWQAWDGTAWSGVQAQDSTGGLRSSGVVRLQLKGGLAPGAPIIADGGLYWIRCVRQAAGGRPSPVLRRIALNTVPATQTETARDELLGTSTGAPRQVFRAVRAPIVGKVELEVREPDVPAPGELAHWAHGEHAVRIERDEQDNVQAVWVPWREVDDFLCSGPDDRHFVVNRPAGEILFGDGLRGRIPPAGANNLRLAAYRSGGGAAGNQPVGAVSQLRTTVPFVAGAKNPEPAMGGQDTETLLTLRERGARFLRHQGRAVTREDYEDLAVEASPAVARARCHPARNLLDPSKAVVPGTLSVVVVPLGAEPEPKPAGHLLEQVRRFLRRCSPPDVDIITLAPEYVRISVELEIGLLTPLVAIACIGECERRLRAFLHPLSGGVGGRGWDFGRIPTPSDFQRLFDGIEGLAYAQTASVKPAEERPGLLESGEFLISPGTLGVYPVSDEAQGAGGQR